VVLARSIGNNNYEWLTRGVVANYNELKHHIDRLDSETHSFLKNLNLWTFRNCRITKMPSFLKNSNRQASIYNVLSNLERNRSIVFEKDIGVKQVDLVKWIKKIKPSYFAGTKNYYQILMDYFDLIKVE